MLTDRGNDLLIELPGGRALALAQAASTGRALRGVVNVFAAGNYSMFPIATDGTSFFKYWDRFFLGNSSEVFALRVQGESMIDDGIHDGDFIFVKKQPRARPGEIVVAFERGVELGDVSGVMLAVVDFHGLRINMRLQRVMRVGEIG